jgi:hypothetical protein
MTPPPNPVEVEPVVSWVLSSEASFSSVGVTSSCPRIAPPGKASLWMLKYMFPARKAVMSAAVSAAALSGTNQWSGPPTSGIVMPPAIPRAAVWTCAAVTLSTTPVLTTKPLTLPVAVSTVKTPPPTPVEVDPVVSWALSRAAILVRTVEEGGEGGAGELPPPPHATRVIEARKRAAKQRVLLFPFIEISSFPRRIPRY